MPSSLTSAENADLSTVMRDASITMAPPSSSLDPLGMETILDGVENVHEHGHAGSGEEVVASATSEKKIGEEETPSTTPKTQVAVVERSLNPTSIQYSMDTVALDLRHPSTSFAELAAAPAELASGEGDGALLASTLAGESSRGNSSQDPFAVAGDGSPPTSREGDGKSSAAMTVSTVSSTTIVDPDARLPHRPSSPLSSPTKKTSSSSTTSLRGGSNNSHSLQRFKTTANAVKIAEQTVTAIQHLSAMSKSQEFRQTRQDVVRKDTEQDLETTNKASVNRQEKMLESTAMRSALQLALCTALGMYNYCEPAVNDVLPFATFQIITYIFLSESTAGLIVVKSMNRVIGTLVGATLGWLVIRIMAAAAGAQAQRVIAGVLVSVTLGVGQYCKTKYNRPYAFTMFNLTFWLVIALTFQVDGDENEICLLYTSPSPRDATLSRMPSSA